MPNNLESKSSLENVTVDELEDEEVDIEEEMEINDDDDEDPAFEEDTAFEEAYEDD